MTIDQHLKARLDTSRVLAVPIRELGVDARDELLTHLQQLGKEDRYLRFGSPISDDAMARYVDGIDFSKDTVFGVYDDQLKLCAAGHFARLPDDQAESGVAGPVAEFGLSVSESARGSGIGTALFVRAAVHARNLGVRTLFMHCLSQNAAMMRIARKAGMDIRLQAGEADAYIELPPADAASLMREVLQEQMALLDFAYKQNLRAANAWFAPLRRAA